MNKPSKIISLFVAVAMSAAASLAAAPLARAALTPSLSLASGGNGDSVTVSVTGGDPNSGVILSYSKTNVGPSLVYLGATNASGSYSVDVSTSQYSISTGGAVSVTVNGQRSNSVTWPDLATNGTFYLSQTAVVLSVGQSTTITATNQTGNSLYLSNNSNPPIANINISGNQITAVGISYGSTVATFCAQGSTTNCASAYITVRNSGAQALTFNLSSVTISTGQSFPVTVSGGTGTYSILNNSNSAAIQTSVSGSVVTLTANGSSGSSAITVCSSDMSSCGIINVTIGATSSSPLTFSQTNPTLLIGQNLSIGVSGGTGTAYYVSSNSNSAVVQASVSGSSLMLYGSTAGTATVTVCSSAGSCGWLAVTVNYVASGGPIQLSQTSLSLLSGQVLSVTVSGGTAPYSLGANTGTVVQASLNGSILTLSGISAGAKSLDVCSAGGACTTLSVIVNSSGSSSTLTFSQTSLSLAVGLAAAVTLYGNGGYYVSNSSNQGVATVQIVGNIAIVSAMAVGNSNVSVCQTGGQCAILFVGVIASTNSNSLPAFSQTNPVATVGQALSLTISGGAGTGYYIAANSNAAAAQTTVNGSTLTITGQTAGSATLVVCAASDSCKPLTITVNAATGAAPVLSQNSIALTAGQSQTVAISGSGSYTLSSNSNPSAVSVQINGSSLALSALALGNSTLSVCQTGGQCATLAVSVAAAVNTTTPAPVTPSGLASGTLVNDHGTIYLVANKVKIPFASLKAFLGLGYALANVTNADASAYPASGILKSATQAHPDGSWIVSGRVVFYVAAAGYIPVPTWNVFLNNGGEAKFIVRANQADISDPRPILSAMANNDTRVVK
ncbi:MAG: hypothetical protein M1400_01640 [Patescibacteria group bacterium]|nr:hypothetical protein [Patescibacteria group bacterium]